MDSKTPLMQLKNITKRFGDITANEGVDLTVYQGEILALLGENGSGKTTLMNMISGLYYPDEGEILINGKPVAIRKPEDAFALGIGMVYQHFKLVDVFTATENIVLGLKEKGALDLKKAAARVKEICDTYGFDLDPDQKIYRMSVSQKQTVEIVKVLYRGADILILDEPTAVLTPQEAEKLFAVLRKMKADGKTVIIITHRLDEVLSLSDRVSILRKGHHICDLETKNTNTQELTDAMVGHAVTLNIQRDEPEDPKPSICVEGLTVKDPDGVYRLKNVSFEIRSGEILGIAGISGSGQKELLESIAGLQHAESGHVYYINKDGSREDLLGLDPVQIRQKGVALSFVPEDRLGMGLVGTMDLGENVMLRSFRRGRSFFTDRKHPYNLARRIVKDLQVNTPDVTTEIRKLSGGNIQKVLVGREINNAPKVLLTAYAVRGLDINSSYMIYDLLNQQKQKGVAVVYVGGDLDVLLELCDRILVLCGGQANGVLDGRTASKNEVVYRMTKAEGEEAS